MYSIASSVAFTRTSLHRQGGWWPCVPRFNGHRKGVHHDKCTRLRAALSSQEGGLQARYRQDTHHFLISSIFSMHRHLQQGYRVHFHLLEEPRASRLASQQQREQRTPSPTVSIPETQCRLQHHTNRSLRYLRGFADRRQQVRRAPTVVNGILQLPALERCVGTGHGREPRNTEDVKKKWT